jgi:hypothetical protein
MDDNTFNLYILIGILTIFLFLLAVSHFALARKFKEFTGDEKPKKEKFIGRNNFGGRPQIF